MNDMPVDLESLIVLALEDNKLPKFTITTTRKYYETYQPSSTTYPMVTAACLAHESNFQKALQILLVHTEDPSFTSSYFFNILLGLIYQKLFKHSIAFNYFLKAKLLQVPSHQKPYLLYFKSIESLVIQNRFKEAIDFYEEIPQEISNQSEKLLMKIGLCYEYMNNIPKACECYLQVSSTDSKFAKTCLIWVYILRGEMTKAFEELNEHRETYESRSQSWADFQYLLGVYYIKAEDYKAAFKILKPLTKAESHKEYYYSALGYLHMKFNCIPQAFVSYLLAASSNQNIPEIWFNIAVIYTKVGQDESNSALDKARGLDNCRLLPQEQLGLESQLLMLKYDISRFGESINASQSKAKRQDNRKKTAEESVESMKNQIAKPVPVKNCQVSLPTDQINFRNNRMFLWQNCFSFFEQIKKTVPGMSNLVSPLDSQAAEILTNLTLPTKRIRENN